MTQGTIIYDEDTDWKGTERIKEFIGGSFPPCPDCSDSGTIPDEYGGHDCPFCASRLLPIRTRDGVQGLDWGDTLVKTDEPGVFEIIRGANW